MSKEPLYDTVPEEDEGDDFPLTTPIRRERWTTTDRWTTSRKRFIAVVVVESIVLGLVTIAALVNFKDARYWRDQSWQNGFSTDYWELRGVPSTWQTEFFNNMRPNHTSKEWVIEWQPDGLRYGGPPGPETDRIWNELLQPLSFWREGADAEPIKGKTYTYDNGKHLVGLSVYHALHCVDSARRSLYSEQYPEYSMVNEIWAMHMNHCLDYLRQYAQCNADLTPMFFEEISLDPMGPGLHPEIDVVPKTGVPHTCRDFSQIHEWVMTHNPSPPNFLEDISAHGHKSHGHNDE